MGSGISLRVSPAMTDVAGTCRVLLLALARFRSDVDAVQQCPRTSVAVEGLLEAMRQDGCRLDDPRGSHVRARRRRHNLACKL